VLEQVRKEP